MIRKILLGVVALLVLMQFYRPARENPVSDPTLGVVQHLNVPEEIGQILRTSCFDCHSNETVWPWYSQFAPMSWLVTHDVNEGREYLNFSTWGSLNGYRAQHTLEEIAEEVGEGKMPLRAYLPAHPEAKLDASRRTALVAWANAERARVLATLESVEGGDEGDE